MIDACLKMVGLTYATPLPYQIAYLECLIAPCESEDCAAFASRDAKKDSWKDRGLSTEGNAWADRAEAKQPSGP